MLRNTLARLLAAMLPISFPHSLALALLFAGVAGCPLDAQCSNPVSTLAAVSGYGNTVHDSLVLPDGSVVVIGEFNTIGGVQASSLARWDGTSWSEFAGGLDPGSIGGSLALLPNGDLLVGGSLSVAGSSISQLARWDGIAWSGYGLPPSVGVSQFVQTIHVEQNGDLIIGSAGSYGIQHWDGTAWTLLGASPLTCWDIARLDNGDLVASGQWPNTPTPVRRWSGSTWDPIGGAGWTAAPNQVPVGSFLLPRDGGTFLLGGRFTQAPGGGGPTVNLARWDGATWSGLGAGVPGLVRDMLELPDGDLIAVGWFPGTVRWDGSQWSPLTSPLDAYSASRLPNDDLLLAGRFNVRRLTTTCPATVVPYGSGCPGSSGPVMLDATRPWIGAPWTATGMGFATPSIVAVAFGTGAALMPLPSTLPQAPSGCDLLLNPLFVDLRLAVAGQVQVSFPLPDNTVLVGQSFRHQMLGVELDPAGTIALVSVTNGVVATIGAF